MTAPDLTAREAVRARLGVVVLCGVVRNATSAITVRVAGTTHSVPAWEIADALDAMLDALVTAERERDAVRSDNNQAHEYLGGTDTIGLVDLAAVRAGELARAQELCETRRLYIEKLHKEQLERFKQGCAFCGAMNWFVTASGGHRCGSCGNIFDAPIIDEARTDG